MRSHRIAAIPGDGIGKEVAPAGLRALAVCTLGIARIPGDDIGVPECSRYPRAHRWCSCACVRKPNPSSVSISTCTGSGTPCGDRHAIKLSGLTKAAPPLRILRSV